MIKRYICTFHGHECESIQVTKDNYKDIPEILKSWELFSIPYEFESLNRYNQEVIEIRHSDNRVGSNNAWVGDWITRTRHIYKDKWKSINTNTVIRECLTIPDGLEVNMEMLFKGDTEFSKTFIKWSNRRREEYGCKKIKGFEDV